jgi:glutathione S-transferase
MMWVIAALNSLEPFFLWLMNVDVFQAANAWTKEARPSAEALVKKRLGDLAERLKGREWLEDRFSAGDLMMADALRMLDHTDLVKADPVLGPYLERCLARPAFKRAVDAQLANFTGEPPKGGF